MCLNKKFIAVILSLILFLSTVPFYVFAASDIDNLQTPSDTGNNGLSFKTEIYKYDSENKKWIVANNVERGETVKARVFIETEFAVGDGQVLCFFNNDVFSIEDAKGLSIVSNKSETSTAYKFLVNGSYSTPSITHNNITNLVKYGYITQQFLETYSPIIFTFRFESYKCHAISGDEWFVEFELKVKDDAFGKGDFLIVPETVVNPNERYYAYINMVKGEEGKTTFESTESLMDWNANVKTESKPVSSGYARAVFDANGGTISADNSNISTVISKVGDIITIPDVNNRNDFTFSGWACDDKNTYNNRFSMPDYNINFTAQWISKTEQTTVAPTTTEPTVITTTQAPTIENTTQTETTTAAPTTTEPTVITTTQAPTIENTTQTETTTTEPTATTTSQAPAMDDTTTQPQITTVSTTAHKHKFKTVIKNPSCESDGEKYQICEECNVTIGEVTVISAIGHEASEWQIISEPSYESEGRKIKKCTRKDCNKIIEEESIPMLKPKLVELKLQNPSRTSIDYGDSIYLHAIADLPDGAKIVWETNNSNFSYIISDNGKTCLISPSSDGETVFTAKIIDKDGNVISDIKTQEMTSKAGFFKKIVGFFKKLFGLIKVYDK